MSKFKVVITDFSRPENEIEAAVLSESGLDIDLVRLDTRDPDEIVEHAADADALIVQFTPITRQIIARLRDCRAISRYGIGVDMVDIPAATDHGIMVCNVPDFCIEEVSTHTIAFLLNLNRRIHHQDRHVRSGAWGSPPGGAPARLQGQVLGILGLGNIGQAVARKARCLGLRIVAYDPYVTPARAKALGVEMLALEDMLQVSDYVTIHCPLTDETRHIIGQPEFALMKPSAFLINMARGPVVDQQALYQALVASAIAGAALDVLEQEPPVADDPLLQLESVILTPHTSSWSEESATQLRRDVATNVVTVLRGGVPASTLNAVELGLTTG